MEARGWRIVIGGVILHLTLGTLYCFGNIQTYLVSYMRAHAADSADLRKSDSTWIFTLATTGQAIAMFFGGRLEQKIGPRWTVLLGGWITSGAVALTALTCSVSKWLVFLTYGLLFGIGVGLCYTAPFVCAMRWMPHRSGVVSGFVVAGFGGGAAIFDQVQTLFVNPHNIKPEIFGGNTEKLFHPHDVDRVPYMFLLLACIYAVMQLVAAMMMSNPPTNPYQRFDDRITSLMPATSEEKLAAVEPTAPELPTTLAVKTRQFWTMWFGFCLNAFNIVFLSTLYKAFGETFIEDDHFLTWVGTFASIFNALGRICWGQIGDWVSFRVAIVTLSLAFGGTIASL
jgi:MFS family permease